MYNLFDFDGTIYDGDSSVDFYFFCMKKKFKIVRFIPLFIWYAILYILGIKTKEEMKGKFFRFVSDFSNIDELVIEFWNKKEKKIKKFYRERVHSKDIIISASPEFLVKVIGDRLGVYDVIASDIDKGTGECKGINCYGENKVILFKKKYKRLKVNEVYSDNFSDKFMVSLGKRGYYVSSDKVMPWKEDIYDRYDKNFGKIILFFFLVYLFYGILLSYHYNFWDTYNLLFEADTSRIIGDFSNIFADHYRIQVHPLLILFVQPIVLALKGITQDEILSILIFLSFVSSLSVGLIYKILSIFQENKKLCVLISLIFGFSFSNIVFTGGIELYNIAALVLVSFAYLICLIIKDKISNNMMFYLTIMGILLFSITVTNYVVFLIGCLILLISKKKGIVSIIGLNGIVILCIVVLSYGQNYIWHNTSLVTNFMEVMLKESNETWVNFDVGITEGLNVINNNYINSIISGDMYIENIEYPRITFGSSSFISIIFIFIFYSILFYYVFKNGRKNKYINLFLIFCLLFNTCFHIIYGNDNCFLYSQHFLYLIILLLGINCEDNILLKLFMIVFLIYEFMVNQLFFKKLIYLVGNVLNKNYFLSNLDSWVVLLILLIVLVIVVFLVLSVGKDIKKLFINDYELGDERAKSIILMIFKGILVVCVFISLKTTSLYEKFWFFDVKEYVNKKYDLGERFSYEYGMLENYKYEYSAFVNDYNVSLNYDYSDIYFYLFGMGNREKFVFKDKGLVSLNDGSVYLKLDILDYKIIPNLYMVVFKLKNGEYGKIFENEYGIFIDIEGKIEVIEDKYVSMYDFSSYKYPNVMKVLYSELLFNISDGMFRPNIIVYDEVWYRDAAVGAMVLEKTGDVYLISKGISNINNIYDRCNDGTEEADNLGEVMYLLSLIDDPDQELISSIIDEALRISSDGYIKGVTDFAPLYYYQNAWYQFGIEKLGLESSLIMPSSYDSYTSSAWWYKKSDISTLNRNINYPYLAWAEYHGVGNGEVYSGASGYPISYESNASEANYDKLEIIDPELVDRKSSPTHVWTAAEMLLVLLDSE